jgi:tRNA threonylcarbamoyladenosine biosynthesis protein TsaB
MSGPLLAIDSSTRAAHAAVCVEGRILATESVAAGASASAALLPAIDRVVRAAGLVPDALAGVIVGGGPGSFTGLRIAAATAKGIAAALGIPLHAHSGLLALAAAHRDEAEVVCSLFDARNREVFAGCWSFAEGIDERLAVQVLPVDVLAERLAGTGPRFTGDGARLHREVLEAAFGPDCVAEAGRNPAEGLCWLTRAVPGGGRVGEAGTWEPDYLRAAGVERSAGGGAG